MWIFLRTCCQVPFSSAGIFVYVIQFLLNEIFTSAIFPVEGITPHFMLFVALPVFQFLAECSSSKGLQADVSQLSLVLLGGLGGH